MRTINDLTRVDSKTLPSIHPDAMIGHVALTVANLDQQIAFYRQTLGLIEHWREGRAAGLGAGGADLLRLVEQPNARKYRRVTGLYHFAILFPNRRELARRLARLFALGYPNYPTDHIMTKTTYLDDPEGNGIELYAESPEDGWMGFENGEFIARRADGSLSSGREPLDVEALFSLLNEEASMDAPVTKETRIGHVHLHIGDIGEAVDFYHGLIGFDLMGRANAMRAAFVSAGGYHHHIGLNTWQGEGAPAPLPDALGLRYYSVVLPDSAELAKVVARIDVAGIPKEQKDEGILVRDPSQNGVLFVVGEK